MVADGGQSGVDCAHFGCAGSVSLTIFRNGACPHKSLLQIGHGKRGFVWASFILKILGEILFCNTAICVFLNEGQLWPPVTRL